MSSERYRVLALIDTISVSGPGRQLALSSRHLRSLAVDVRLVLFRRPAAVARPFESFLDAHEIPYSLISERYAFDMQVVTQLQRLVDEHRPHVVQTHSYKASVSAASARWRGMRVPWLAFYHGRTAENLKVRGYHALDRFLMRRADAVVVMAKSQIAEIGNCRGPVELLHNAILDQPLPFEAQFSGDTVAQRLLCVGRLSREKGVDVLLDALALLHQTHSRVRLTIVGDGPERANLERQCDTLGLREVVTFVGFQPDPEPFFRTASVLVIPSRSEGLPNVLLEAIAFGLPVVSTRVGAVPDVLANSPAGVLCAIEDPFEMADCIRRSLTPLFRENGQEARRQLLDRFSLEHRSDRLIQIYRGLLARTISSSD